MQVEIWHAGLHSFARVFVTAWASITCARSDHAGHWCCQTMSTPAVRSTPLFYSFFIQRGVLCSSKLIPLLMSDALLAVGATGMRTPYSGCRRRRRS